VKIAFRRHPKQTQDASHHFDLWFIRLGVILSSKNICWKVHKTGNCATGPVVLLLISPFRDKESVHFFWAALCFSLNLCFSCYSKSEINTFFIPLNTSHSQISLKAVWCDIEESLSCFSVPLCRPSWLVKLQIVWYKMPGRIGLKVGC